MSDDLGKPLAGRSEVKYPLLGGIAETTVVSYADGQTLTLPENVTVVVEVSEEFLRGLNDSGNLALELTVSGQFSAPSTKEGVLEGSVWITPEGEIQVKALPARLDPDAQRRVDENARRSEERRQARLAERGAAAAAAAASPF
jgi:hypothetical protein